MHKCRDMWSDLYKHCFDADINTTTFVELYGGMCALFSAALQLFAKQQPLSLVLSFVLMYVTYYSNALNSFQVHIDFHRPKFIRFVHVYGSDVKKISHGNNFRNFASS